MSTKENKALRLTIASLFLSDVLKLLQPLATGIGAKVVVYPKMIPFLFLLAAGHSILRSFAADKGID
jgi:hypothetical protein